MNAPEKFPKNPVAPGVFVLTPAPAKTVATRRQAATFLLMAMRRSKRFGAGSSGKAYLKVIRNSRHAG